MEPFRFRLKVYTHPDGRQFAVVGSVWAEGKDPALHGSPVLRVFLMSDPETFYITMTVAEYNALPHHWFEDKGPAPKLIAKTPEAL
jgi:hypothetical protein